MLQTGTVIDRYVVESILGTGGTAVVYLVRHQTLGTRHALKVLSVTSDSIRKRMIREGQVQAAMRHLNVVAVTDVIDVDGQPGLLLEYIGGPALDQALKKYQLTLGDAEVLFNGILAGVRHAHQQDLVHRDLKPSNVLLSRTPDGFVPKVTDFGLAKILVDAEGDGAHTRSGIAMGTPAYMSPEQIRDARNVDQRADIFSLGCILYELVCGQRAFGGDEALRIYNSVTGGEFTAPRDLVPDLPERFDMAIRGALTVDRDRRIPDCETLQAVLQGDRPWDVPVGTGQNVRTPVMQPHRLASDAPNLPLAARGPGNETPPPPPERLSASGGGIAMTAREATDSLHTDETPKLPPGARVAGVDGTLSPSDSMISGSTQPPASGLTWLLGGATAFVLVVAVLLTAVIITLAFVYGSSPPTLVTEVEHAGDHSHSVADAVPATPPEEPPAEEDGTADAVPEPPPDPEPVVEPKPKPKPKPRPVSKPKPKPQPVVTAEPEVPALVTVKILSKPPTATVWIDGGEVGKTPKKLELTPGPHRVEVQSGDDRKSFSIDVSESSTKWCYDFGGALSYEGSCP